MVVYTVSDAAEFKDDNFEVDRNTLFFIVFERHQNKHILNDIKKLSDDPALSDCKFHASDADESDELADEYHIKRFPTCGLLKGGEIVAKVPTLRDQAVIREYIQKNS